MMRVGSLFAGIGGFDLAARWMGWETAWFSEIDPYASAVLEKHWPGVPNHGDITQIDFTQVKPVDLLCGGFPCQDISNAGRRKGIEGERSGLWSEYARAIGELRPRYVVVENVAALLGRGLERVLGDLAALGYDAEWQVLSAADVGAPHLRERLWIAAYADGQQYQGRTSADQRSAAAHVLADPDSTGSDLGARLPVVAGTGLSDTHRGGGGCAGQRREDVADPAGPRCVEGLCGQGGPVRDGARSSELERRSGGIDGPADWATEPDVGRVAHGIPSRVDRLKGLGNAIVPLCAYLGPFRVVAEREALRCVA